MEPDEARPLHDRQGALLNHRLGSAQCLLGRLEDEHVAPRQVLPARRQHGCGAQQGGDVDVVPAGVHHALHL